MKRTHFEIQEKLLNRLVLVLGIITIPALLFSLPRIIQTSIWQMFYFHIVLGGFNILMAVFRKVIPFHVKVTFLEILFFILAMLGGVNFGLSAFFIEFLMIAVLISTIFWGRKGAFWVYILAAISIIGVGGLTYNKIITPDPSVGNYTSFLFSWMNALSGFSLMTGLIILIVGEIGYLLAERISELEIINEELEKANNEIRQLQGILPICARCKKIKNDEGYWTQVELYIENHSPAKFSHSLCESCADELYGKEEWYKNYKKNKK